MKMDACVRICCCPACGACIGETCGKRRPEEGSGVVHGERVLLAADVDAEYAKTPLAQHLVAEYRGLMPAGGGR